MKLAIIGAVIGATLIGALPAAAEIVVRAGDSGVAVRHVDHRYVERRHADRGHHYGWRNHRASCRTISTRTHRANGTVVIRKRTVC